MFAGYQSLGMVHWNADCSLGMNSWIYKWSAGVFTPGVFLVNTPGYGLLEYGLSVCNLVVGVWSAAMSNSKYVCWA